MPESSHVTRGYSAALASAVILSTAAIFIRHLNLVYGLPALILACWRDFMVTFCLLIVMGLVSPARLKLNRRHLGFMLWFGLMLALFNALWTLSVSLNGASISTVLAYSSAAFTALLGRWLLKESLDWGKILAVVLSLAGCVMVSGSLQQDGVKVDWLGIIVGILSGLWYAIYTLMGRSASQRGINPWTTLLYTFALAGIFLLVFNLFSGGTIPGAAAHPADMLWLGTSWRGWGILFLLAAGPTLTGFGLYNVGLSFLPSFVVNLIATSEPVFTAVIAYFLLDERLTWVQVAGGLLILGAVVLLRLWERRIARRTGVVNEPTLPL